MKIILLAVVLNVGNFTISFAHEKHIHLNKVIANDAVKELALSQVRTLYENTVKNIFQKSCFTCHGQMQTTLFPWYYKVPGIQQLIDHDVTEAKKHLDITQGFPFKGHGTPQSDLEAIEESIKKNSMPPWRFEFMHGDAKLSQKDKKAILDWIAKSKELLYD
jgi:cytochrome c551/c552